ncbi:NAD(P)H-binding protein [Paenibacillus peoriae]|uniref:NAD(P)H-binding protein n=1 Tax=Paenibacillus peoriae TaxID=59893 RepID=UPI0021162B80|nr:NAD(P)H-binding protein [Paenibacillus peoriae]
MAYVRRADALPENHPNLQVVVGSLDDHRKMKDTFTNSDAVISALGPAQDKSRKVKDLSIPGLMKPSFKPCRL